MLIQKTNNCPATDLTEKTPKVSVCVSTYNHEKYIRQCLQSIVDQETNFGFEVIVGDDCSTDGTRDIVREFAARYPRVVRTIFHEQNIGAAFNYAKTHGVALGDYVAHIDGDDLMLPGKLKKQVEIIIDNPSCVMVTHDSKLLSNDGSILIKTFKRHKQGVNSILDLYGTLPFFAHSSKLVRRDVEKCVLQLIDKNTTDIELHVAMAKYGDIYHIDEPFGIYRTGVGVSSNVRGCVNNLLVEATISIFNAAIKNHPEWAGGLKRAYAKAMLNYAYQAAVCKNKDQLTRFLKQSVDMSIINPVQLLFLSLPANIVFALVGFRSKIRYRK